ncbi:hypothetical protein [Polyangium fumosum]|uniref:Secreted protein n=1 Tax=Polyangium fumosum TaxID=889272 RepID=A0A4U1IAI3_9BACT|nr:hypothetical protein [Polyangium fumosum]TKC90564.1 hypothetical protein E8A74_50870 [Polyangium fumosum]
MYAVFAFFAVSTAGACSGQAPASSDQAPATPQAIGASTTSVSAPPSSDPQPTATVEEPQTAPTNTAGTQVPAASGCDPAKEPHRRYLGDREKCMLMKFRCEPPQTMFSNACGCGCE